MPRKIVFKSVATVFKWLFSSVFVVLLIFASAASAEEDDQLFTQWLLNMAVEAKVEGISQQAVDYTVSQAKFSARVIELDRAQPEFIQTFSTYSARRIQPKVVQTGKELIQANVDMLHAVEQLYGVPKEVLVSFWALETNFGKNQGGFNLASALVTLAYEGRRAQFFKDELFAFMRVLDEEKHYAEPILGSWAGATGHMQFMPSTLLKYGVDGDEDGKVNIWSSLPDVFTSAANYLSQVGWQASEPAALVTTLPDGFDYGLAQLKVRKTAKEWLKLGVTVPKQYEEFNNIGVLLPQGYKGPAFLIFSNFDVIMTWNRSVNYALSVSLLSQHFSGYAPDVKLAEDNEGLSYEKMRSLQAKLNSLGYDCGSPDGFPGAKTQAAVRRYQATVGLPQDGYAGPSLFNALLENK